MIIFQLVAVFFLIIGATHAGNENPSSYLKRSNKQQDEKTELYLVPASSPNQNSDESSKSNISTLKDELAGSRFLTDDETATTDWFLSEGSVTVHASGDELNANAIDGYIKVTHTVGAVHNEDCVDIVGCSLTGFRVDLLQHNCLDPPGDAENTLIIIENSTWTPTNGNSTYDYEINIVSSEISSDYPNFISFASNSMYQNSRGNIQFCTKIVSMSQDVGASFRYRKFDVSFDLSVNFGPTSFTVESEFLFPSQITIDIDKDYDIKAFLCNVDAQGYIQATDTKIQQDSIMELCLIPQKILFSGDVEDTRLAEISNIEMSIIPACIEDCISYEAIQMGDDGWETPDLFTTVEELTTPDNIKFVHVKQRMLVSFFDHGSKTLSVVGFVHLKFREDLRRSLSAFKTFLINVEVEGEGKEEAGCRGKYFERLSRLLW